MLDRMLFVGIGLIFVMPVDSAWSQEPAAQPAAEAAAEEFPVGEIEAAVASYATAFNARDAEKLAAHWAPEGVYTSRATGERITGRAAMVAEFQQMFAGDSVPNLAVSTESIDFISPNVALERGIATVTWPDEEIVETSYSVVYVKQDGAWLIDRVTEDELVVETSNRDFLEPLGWLIGEWVDEMDGATVEFDCQWTRNENFIARKYKVTSADNPESSGLQIIGWDPVNSQIRSWLFDSDGSFISGIWTENEGQWVVQSRATLADGSQGSFTSIYRPLEDGTIGWQKVNRVLDGELLPSIDEVIIRPR